MQSVCMASFDRRVDGAEGEIRTPEDYSSGFRDRRHTGLGYLGFSIPTYFPYKGFCAEPHLLRVLFDGSSSYIMAISSVSISVSASSTTIMAFAPS